MKITNIFKCYRGLPKSVYILFTARVINAMGNFVFPLLTMFLTGKLLLSPKTAGLFVSLSSLAWMPGGIIGGKLSDLIGRKKVMVLFQGAVAFCFIPCVFLGKSMLIPWLLILSSLLNGAVQPASNAMIADLTDSKNRKSAFSLIYLGFNIGFSIGPIIAGFLYKNYFKFIFVGNAAASLISSTLIAIFIKESIPDKVNIEDKNNNINEDEKAEEGSIFKVLARRPEVIAYALLAMIYTFSYSQGSFSTTLLLKQLFEQDASKMVGTLSSVNGFVVITMTTIIIGLTRKFKPLFNIALAGVFFAFGFGMQFFISNFYLFVISTVIWTIGEILNATNSGVYIADHSPISHRGRFNSFLYLITGAGSALGPVIMGYYIERFSVRMVWPLVFIMTMISSALLFMLSKKDKKSMVKI